MSECREHQGRYFESAACLQCLACYWESKHKELEANIRRLQIEGMEYFTELEALRKAIGRRAAWIEIDGERVYTSYDTKLKAEVERLRELLKTARGSNYHWPKYFTKQVDEVLRESGGE